MAHCGCEVTVVGIPEHTVVPEVMAHRLLRRTLEHLQERKTCRETELEVHAEDMRDLVTKRVDMALIRYKRESFVVISTLCFCCGIPAATCWCRVPAACF